MDAVTKRRDVLIRQEYRLKSGRTVVVRDVPAQVVAVDGRSGTNLTIAVVRQLEKLVEKALAESQREYVELKYEPAPTRDKDLVRRKP